MLAGKSLPVKSFVRELQKLLGGAVLAQLYFKHISNKYEFI
jgi:hypothetical protein